MKIKHLKKVVSRYGEIYYYDRISGKRVKSLYGTNEFLAEVAMLRAGSSARPNPNKVETFGDLRAIFQADPEYLGLGARSKEDYDAVFKYLAPIDSVRLEDIDTPYVSSIKRKAHDARSWSFANKVLASISRMFNWGREPGFTKFNPVEGVSKYKRPKGTPEVNRAWSDDELAIVLKHARPSLQTAIALGAYTGLRESDVVKLPTSAITDVIRLSQGKTDKPIVLPVHRDLKPYLKEAIDRDGRNAVTVVVGERGRTMTAGGFKGMFFKLIGELKAKDVIPPGLTFHGLRHTVGTRLAEAGASDTVIQSMLGHKTPAMAQRYRRDAAQKKGAEIAMGMLENRVEENKE